MTRYTQKDFIKLLKKNSQSIRHTMLEEGTDCMRVYDRHQGDFPITVDLYSNYARIVDYSDEPLDEETKSFCVDTVARMLYVPVENVVYSYRAKRHGKEQHEKNDVSLRTTVHESNLEFEVELASYADTGLFIDHYRTRQMVKEMCRGMDVLNLFSYTGSFSVYAAAGLAKSVTSVDLSSTYTKWAEENLVRNGYSGNSYRCVCEDAAKFIEECRENKTKYDLIIFDPPSFSNSHKMDKDFDVGRDGIDWIKKLTGLLRKDGTILFSTNLGSFRMDKRRLKGLSVQEISDRVMAPGFVKSRKGAVRSWIMTLDDDSLNLDWSDEGSKKSEEPAKENVKKENSEKEFGKNEYKPGRNYGSDRYGKDGNKRGNYRRDSEGRNGRNGERRYSDRRDSGRRSDSDRYGRDSRRSDDRPRRREYDSDNRGRSFSSERRYSERRSEGHSEGRSSYSDSYSDRPKRNYSGDYSSDYSSDDRPRRREYDSEHSPERYSGRSSERYSDHYSGRNGRNFSDRDGERRYSDRRDSGRRFDSDRPKREFNDGERKTGRREYDSDRPKYSRTDKKSSGPKPYGYDSFKPARSRNDDDPDLFWN